MELVFDIGMYDASDTEYYLSEGYKVIAVEANPSLINSAGIRFKEQVSSGQLVLVNRALSQESGAEITLTICNDDLAASSIFKEKLNDRIPVDSSTLKQKVGDEIPTAAFTVKGITMVELIEEYGHPYFIKVDIEGADRYCVLPLNGENRPQYMSFEIGDDVEELIGHLERIGFAKFKIINQTRFIELNDQRSLAYRAKCKIIKLLGEEVTTFTGNHPTYVIRNGRSFLLGHSAGPAPWASDGNWSDANHLLAKWKSAGAKNKLWGWYDMHAM
jgi:FkbM family methyltransferase